MGPGGPTGIFGRPFGRLPGFQGNQGFIGGNYGGFAGNHYPQQGLNQFGAGGFPFQGGFDGGHNGINPQFGNGGGGGFNPYFQGNSFGGAYPSYGYGGQQPFYDSTSKNGAVGNKKKVEKSAE